MGATVPQAIDLPPSRLRRIDLERQGLLRRAPFGKGLAGTRTAIERLGYVQIDTISVVSRAHDHVLQLRVPGYRSDHIGKLLRQGAIFEYWAHAAAYLPMSAYRFALPRMRAMRERRERWVRSHDDVLMRRVLDRVRAEGPLKTRDFAAPEGGAKGAGWWDWKPAKRALEQLFMQGDLMVVGRDGFEKVYDLAERALPEWVDVRPPAVTEYADYLIDQQLGAHAIASVRSCCYQRPTPGLRPAVTAALEARARRGDLLAIRVSAGRERWYADPAALAGRAPAAADRARLLSPFDNLIIQRQRGRDLFGYDYQLECYLPDQRRRYGYFCLPLLYRDGLVGRADCKAHRAAGRLEVRALHLEHPERTGPDRERAARAIAGALDELAAANGCAEIELGTVAPRDWRRPLRNALSKRRTET